MFNMAYSLKIGIKVFRIMTGMAILDIMKWLLIENVN
jgi:hypothetical protein